MCGISGFFQSKPVFSEHHLHKMTSVLQHRGPDAEGFYNNQKAFLGHRRLSIIDLSEHANQPMFSHSGNSVIAFNGEIYNYREVAAQLGIKQKTTSDTEVLLEAFELMGPDFVNLLNGMFAMAIYRIDEDKLYLFRDRMGIKPLFYYPGNGFMAFSSELKAIETLEKFQAEKIINYKAVSRFLHLGYIPAPDTIYQQVYKFSQGCYGIYDGVNLNITPYWKIDDKVQSHVTSNKNEALDELKKLVESSVKYRLVADVPYGTFLSGGIDSSLVTAVAQKVAPEKVKTFSIGFNSARHNEAPFARQVASYLGTEHHEFTMSEQDAMHKITDLFTYYDEPFADSSALPTMLVSEMARKHVTMTLSGDGGDELFHGYGMYTWAERLNNPIVRSSRWPIHLVLNRMNNRYKRAAQLFNWQPGDYLPAHIFSQEQYFFSTRELNLLTTGWPQNMGFSRNSQLTRQLEPRELQAFFDLQYYLPDDLLVKVDRASMRYSLETRVPLLDYRIVEFALNLHPQLKVNNGTTKYLLKELLYQYVPREIFDRPKWGFSIPLQHWLKTDLAYLINNYLNEDLVRSAQLVRFEMVSELLYRFKQKEQDFLYNRIWALICLHRWYLERFKR